MLIELTGGYKKVYDNWLVNNETDSPNAAYNAGEKICLLYERPDKMEIEAPIRANNARNIYNVLMGYIKITPAIFYCRCLVIILAIL